MKILAMVDPGPNQRALLCRLHQRVGLCAIALIDLPRVSSRRKISGLGRRLAAVTVGIPFRLAWQALQRHYDATCPDWPAVERRSFASANDPALLEWCKQMAPGLIMVSGTDILRKQTIEALPAPVVNLHTGLSPYIRGGPNCTNWALAIGRFDLIGNTVMWIDPGIDTGAIIATEQTPLDSHETIVSLHRKVMDHAHDLYVRVIERLAAGRPVPRVAQASLGKGQLFYNRQWNAAAMLRALRNMRRFTPALGSPPKLVSLDQVDECERRDPPPND